MFTRKLQLFTLSLPLAFGAANVSADTCEAPDPQGEYKLVFEENFSGSSLDKNKWTTEFLWGPSTIINNETQYYVNDGQFGYNPFKFRNGVMSIEAIKAPFDRSQLYLTRSIYSKTAVELLWRVPSRAVSYEIYRDGELQGTSPKGSFIQRDLRAGIDYAYEVVALDSAGNALVAAQLTVNTADLGESRPRQKFSLGLESKIYSSTNAEIVWRAPNRAGRFEVYRDGRLYRSLNGSTYQSLYEKDLEEGRRYLYRVVSYDRCDEVIASQNVVVNTGNGPTPQQDKVERLVIRTQVYGKSNAEIVWNAVDGVSNYDILDNGEFLLNTDGRSYFIDDLVPGIDRKFLVIAYDSDGQIIDQTSRVLNTADNSFALNRQPFLSGVITSYNSFRFKYGRVEARARMPAGKGLWSAFWLLNAYYNQDQPEDPEIDIIEAIGDRTTTANHAYYFKRDTDGDTFFDETVGQEFRAVIDDFSQGFHTYRVDWEPGRIVYYVDDVETGRVEGPQVSDEQMYIIANLAVGGNFPGPADETTPFPARFELDYIRVYQR